MVLLRPNKRDKLSLFVPKERQRPLPSFLNPSKKQEKLLLHFAKSKRARQLRIH